MNIALDVMGGDHGPAEIIAGAIEAARTYNITISLVGKPEIIKAELAKHSATGLKLPIVPATQVIEMDDKPANVVRSKPDSSMVVACKMVRSGDAQAFVTVIFKGFDLAQTHIDRQAGFNAYPGFGGTRALRTRFSKDVVHQLLKLGIIMRSDVVCHGVAWLCNL